MMFDDVEFTVLQRIEKDGTVTAEDRGIAHALAALGIVHLGYDDSGVELRETSHISSLGKEMMKYEKIKRSPVRSFLHTIFLPFI